MVCIPDLSFCGEVAGGEVELHKLSGSKNVNRTTKTPTSTGGGKQERSVINDREEERKRKTAVRVLARK